MPRYTHGSGCVYRRGKTWWLTYYVNGKQVWESARTRDKAEARRRLHAKLGQLAEGRYVGPAAERMTFDDLMTLVVNDYKANGRRSLDMVELRTRKHLAPFFGGTRAVHITTEMVTAYIARRQAQRAANAEINRELAIVRRGFTLALRAELLSRKPHFPVLKEAPPRQVFFEHHELLALLAKLPEELRGPVQFAATLGWRIKSEVLPLQWHQVDLEEGTVTLRAGTTKTDRARIVWLPDDLRAILAQQWQSHVTHYPECPFVFHRNGTRIRSFKGAWRAACRAAGLHGKVPHDLRRTGTRMLVRSGIPETVAMRVTGHVDRSVFERYNIVSPGDLQQVARVLSTALRRDTAANNDKNNDNRPVAQSENRLSS